MTTKKQLLPAACRVALLLAPVLRLSAQDDTAAVDRLLAQVERATRALSGFRCEASRTNTSATRTATDVAQVAFLRPNFFRSVMKEGGGQRTYTTLSDGQPIYTVREKTYERTGTVSADTGGYHWYHNDLLVLLATGSTAKVFEELPMTPRKRLLPDETWEGESYRGAEFAVEGGYPITYKLYVGKDGLARRLVQTDANNGKPLVFDSQIRALDRTVAQSAADFSFQPGADLDGREAHVSHRARRPALRARSRDRPAKYGTTVLADYASLKPYDVHSCPTNILIDANGRIVHRSSGWNEAALRAALAQLGIK